MVRKDLIEYKLQKTYLPIGDISRHMKDYDQIEIERKWEDWWEKEELYKFDQERLDKVYSIDNPPRYASGSLHIGHATHYTHIDFVARYKRMRGYNVMFPLCFDVNGIPIEERVERKYGVTRKDVDRHEFIRMCEEFAEANINEMTRQFRILGESMDSSIYYKTNAEYYRRLTQISFIRLYRSGYIYKGEFPVNWCPRCMTALADAEIEYTRRTTWLNYLLFDLDDGATLQIATTRPELLCTCQLVAVHPDDPRASELIGRKARTPLYGREVRIVTDERVDPAFGTGVVMICSIGDRDDLEWIKDYGLEIAMAIDEDGKMNDLAGPYAGMTIAKAREAIIRDLRSEGRLVAQEEIEQNVGTCWRCHTPVEFLSRPQWFLKTLPFRRMILDAADEMKWYPEFMKSRLEEWVNSLKWDWVISRQRYFATPIPLWECVSCGHVILAREEDCYVDPTRDPPPLERCPECGSELKGCEDVFDTWMDSSITPLYNTFWLRDDDLFRSLYPMNLRPQAHDIIRTWAFYTILRGMLLTGEKPFREIMMDGFILSEDGTPMHASRGNIIDPLEVLETYGADPLRYYAATCTLGVDNAFRWKDVVRGSRFCRKFYNIHRFIGNALKRLIERGASPLMEGDLRPADHWILKEYADLVSTCTHEMDRFRFNNAMKCIEFFVWHVLADHYIELVKHRTYTKDPVIRVLYTVGLGTTKLVAPFLPHIAEEVYQTHYRELHGVKSIHISAWPVPPEFDDAMACLGEEIKDIVSAVRRWKSEHGLPLNQSIPPMGLISSLDLGPWKEDVTGPTRSEDLLILSSDQVRRVPIMVLPRMERIGPDFREMAPRVADAIRAMDPEKAADTDEIRVDGKVIALADYAEIKWSHTYADREVDVLRTDRSVIVLTPAR